MISDVLIKEFGYNTPIFTSEILPKFPQYTRAYVFRLLKEAESSGEICRLDSGIYYISQETPLGPSVITAADAVRKRYMESEGKIFGIYAGLTLQNMFSVTSQLPNIPEIVTNREATRCRKISVDGMSFFLRRSRTEITNKNADAYRVLQLFTETNGLVNGEAALQAVAEYIRAQKINRSLLLKLAGFFPASTLKNLIGTGII